MSEVATTEAADVKKRNTGPVQTTFADGKTSDLKRVASGVNMVIANGKSYSVATLSDDIKTQLAAVALSSRFRTYVNNHADESKSNVAALLDEVYADLVAGRLYAAGAEGGATKKNKAYDPTLWVAAIKKAREMQHAKNPAVALATDAQLAEAGQKLIDMSPADRTKQVLKYTQHPILGPVYKALKAQADLTANAAKAAKAQSEGKEATEVADVLDI